MKKCAFLVVLAASFAAFANPTVSDVTLEQSGQTRKVSVSYKLTGEAAIVTVDFLTNGVSIGARNFATVSGDVNRFIAPSSDKVRKIRWNPDADWAGMSVSGMTAVVSAWCTNAPPMYLDIELGKSYPLMKRYYVSAEAVPGGITDNLYKTTHLLMRKCPVAGKEWRMGALPTDSSANSQVNEQSHHVVLTEDFYVGVYEFTQAQYVSVGFSNGSTFKDKAIFPDADIQPYTQIGYNDICGSNRPWPNQPDSVGENQILGKLRSYTGIPTFDLPTEAQWECACRAGVDATFYNGKEWTGNADPVTNIAWIADNSAVPAGGSDKGTAPRPVGLKEPNAWGLYDMVGNVAEWCRDREYDGGKYEDLPTDGSAVFDPVGSYATSNIRWIIRGGSYYTAVGYARSCARYRVAGNSSTSTVGGVGFRVMCAAVIPE